MDPFTGSSREVSQWHMGRPHNRSGDHICLWPLILLSASFWISPLPRDRGSSSIFWVLEERVSPSHPQLGKQGIHSIFLFHPWERSYFSPILLLPWVEEQCWQSSFYPLQCSQTHILLLLFQQSARKLSSGNLDFYKILLLSVGICPSQRPQVIPSHSGKKQKLVYKLLPVPTVVLRSVCHQMHKCHGIQCWIPQLS